ncbi:hypothetical protein BO94DRAFT_465033 [Aspergillus sclerotioniger CBS 115572]|uniref:Uncharacterized protein n=1 Tax=Aspergillus sclerotioniger CBS 115572 TaxID=1450535 RepID=A0A317WQA6_9EURO|nr:hypothetical protein BO94DRAFT_465033 [Aspergillus sclerotioniger CBS 115572]PWY88613.1 hypothetical protein BO94DRAFT_465033 [Aspergillus sclerotioniger CBS 115572]
MRLKLKGLAWALLPWMAASSPFPAEERLAVPDGSTHASHIFNALHNSMKMFGSVLQHNGMSIFIATVPEGTEFYHGTSSPYRINGTEWLAFEPEHAMAFAHPRRVRRSKSAADQPHDEKPHAESHSHGKHNKRVDTGEEEQTGYFHTYRTKHPLRLVYFDGQSAAKSLKGTLDMQDILLRNASHFDGSPAEGDNLRADDLCALARDRWDNRVDGFLRMVGGFEIILCSFAKDLDVVSILSTYPGRSGDGGSGLSYARALATRFDGIGGDRVSINYDDFVTMFAYPDAMYFDNHGLPRVVNDSAKLEQVRAHVDRLVKQLDQTNYAFNWQNIVDMIITRYHYRISLMLSSAVSTHHELRRELHLAIEPFINAHARNSTTEVERCAKQFWIAGADMTTVPAQAISLVSERLCSSLVAGAGAEAYDEGLAIIEDLKRYLDWAVFRKCTCCELNEVCQLPIWPSGSWEDFVRPQCGTGMSHGAGGYWDMMGKVRQL